MENWFLFLVLRPPDPTGRPPCSTSVSQVGGHPFTATRPGTHLRQLYTERALSRLHLPYVSCHDVMKVMRCV